MSKVTPQMQAAELVQAALEQSNNPSRAIALLNKARALDPSFGPAWFHLYRMYQSAALACLRQAIAAEPQNQIWRAELEQAAGDSSPNTAQDAPKTPQENQTSTESKTSPKPPEVVPEVADNEAQKITEVFLVHGAEEQREIVAEQSASPEPSVVAPENRTHAVVPLAFQDTLPGPEEPPTKILPAKEMFPERPATEPADEKEMWEKRLKKWWERESYSTILEAAEAARGSESKPLVALAARWAGRAHLAMARQAAQEALHVAMRSQDREELMELRDALFELDVDPSSV